MEIGLTKDVNWLTDLLPDTLRSSEPAVLAKIFCYNYESKWLGENTSSQRLTSIAEKFLNEIYYQRSQVSTLPFADILLLIH